MSYDAIRCLGCGGPAALVAGWPYRRCLKNPACNLTVPFGPVHAEALKADAWRLAELRGEYGDLRSSGEREDGSGNPEHMAKLAALIDVYEECAARGRTFGGVG